ncbi:MAG: hypothetical protein ACRCX8_15945 [Sarcina sp.]
MGITALELKELMDYIQENNGWNKLYQNHKRGRKTPKYINFRMDTRTGDIWLVEFSGVVGGGVNSKEVFTFRTENGYSLKEKVYEWLNEEEIIK